MAIRKRGKQGLYHAYFRGLDERPDGALVAVTREVCLHTSDPVTAAALDQQLREREKRHRAELRARAFARQLMEPDASVPVSAPDVAHNARARRLRLDDALDAAARYADVSPTAAQLWRRFARSVHVAYLDEITPEMVHDYLSQYERGKTWNQNKWAVGRIMKLTRMESGVTVSPVDLILSRRNESRHQRPITEQEFVRLYEAAPEPWATAVLIGWHTGLRQRDVAALRWDQITDGTILTTPGKTSRFGRAVQIPVHPQLESALADLPRVSDYILGAWWPSGRVTNSSRAQFGELLESLGITSNQDGIVNFNSLRDSLATRCDEADIPRHATRGILGHTSDQTTDLYSHDLATARRIRELPAPAITLKKHSPPPGDHASACISTDTP